MRWLAPILGLLLLAGIVLAQDRTEYIGERKNLIWDQVIWDTSVTSGQYAAPCEKGSGGFQAHTDGRIKCYVQRGWSLSITHVGMVLSKEHTSTENCLFTLDYSADGTGTEGSDLGNSELYTDEAFDCDGETKTLDAAGDSCIKRTEQITLQEGAWMQWKVVTGGVGGASCGAAHTFMKIYGKWNKNGG